MNSWIEYKIYACPYCGYHSDSQDKSCGNCNEPLAEAIDIPIKCIYKGCNNRSDQGRFVGSLCAPCYDKITK